MVAQTFAVVVFGAFSRGWRLCFLLLADNARYFKGYRANQIAGNNNFDRER